MNLHFKKLFFLSYFDITSAIFLWLSSIFSLLRSVRTKGISI
jgi:hypothetical protein